MRQRLHDRVFIANVIVLSSVDTTSCPARLHSRNNTDAIMVFRNEIV